MASLHLGKRQGFLLMPAKRRTSLTSIIVGIAVLVALAMIAIPTWRNHQAQTHVADALQMTDAAKLVVMEAATVHGGLASINASALAYTPPVATNPYIANISITEGGVITLVTKNTGATPAPVLVLIPTSGTGDAAAVITWTCTLAVGYAGTVPSTCRASSPIRQVAAPTGAAATGNGPR
jgi:type IV pilus assembly protein PilA